MKKFTTTVCTLAAAALIASPALADHHQHHERHHKAPTNIIFMVPDGMGLSNTTAARIFKNGPNGERLAFEKLANIGYQSTHSANSTVTDSAAAASAWASGDKFINNEISCHGDYSDGSCADMVPTILELAEMKGMASGLVATSQISHATPAAFGAHTISRYCGTEIARQYLEETNVDVILGGGVYKTKDFCNVYADSFYTNKDEARTYIINKAAANGYELVTDKDEMAAAVAAGNKKVLGLFEQNGLHNGKTPEYFRVDETLSYPAGEPTLAEMTAAALDVLEEDQDGFFLMVEGSQIDWEDHANHLEGQIAETLAFEAAVVKVQEWIAADESRKANTLLIVVADHDTGGFAINGPYGTLSEAGDIIDAGWTSGGHTAVDTIVYSQGPKSKMLGKALDNTDLYEVMVKALR